MTKPNPEKCKNCSSKGVYDCAQLQYTIQHRTVLIIFPLTSELVAVNKPVYQYSLLCFHAHVITLSTPSIMHGTTENAESAHQVIEYFKGSLLDNAVIVTLNVSGPTIETFPTVPFRKTTPSIMFRGASITGSVARKVA